MQITLVRPIFNMEELRPILDIPLGLLSLATVLTNAGHTVKIIDMQMLLVKGILIFNDDYYHKCAEMILANEPELIGFTALCNSYPEALLIAKECRALEPTTPIIFGGPQATFSDADTLAEFPWIDAIVRGEGEQVIVQIVSTLEKALKMRLGDGIDSDAGTVASSTRMNLEGILGVTYRTNEGEVIRNADQPYIENLDILPHLNYNLLEYGADYFRPELALSIDVGRGCPYKCRYCSTSLLWRRQFRIKSPERIVAEIQELRDRFGVKVFKLTHDLFTVNKEIALKFSRLLRETCPDVSWSCSARTTTIDEEILQEFARSKCQMIFYGIESGSRETLEYFRKGLDPDEALQVVRLTLAHKIKVMTSFIVGAPEESEADVNQTLLLGLKCKVMGATSAHMHVLIPESGTEICAENKDKFELNLEALRGSMRLANAHSEIEMEMIRKYPWIFSTFYTIRNDQLPGTLLHEIESSFNRVMSYFAKTVYAILLETGWEPLRLLREWKSWWVARNGEEREFILTKSEVIELFPIFVKEMSATGVFSAAYLPDLLNYEEISVNMDDSQYFLDKNPCLRKATSENELLLSEECVIGHFRYDVTGVIEALKNLQVPPTEEREMYLIFRYLGANSVKSILTNEFTFDILRGSAQQVKLSTLKKRMLDKWQQASATVEADFDTAIEQLVYHKFIKIMA